MNKLYSFVVLLICFACDNDTKMYLRDSNGALGSLTVVTKHRQLTAYLIDTLKTYIARPMRGVPASESVIDLNYLQIDNFKGFAQASRNILIIKSDTLEDISFQKDVFAKPQSVVSIGAGDTNRLYELIREHSQQIIDTVYAMDRQEKLQRILKSPNKENVLQDSLGIALTMPSVFYIGPARNGHFFWASRNITRGQEHLLVYEIPHSTLDNRDNVMIQDAIRQVRDSIGKHYIPGREEGMYYTTAKLPPDTHMVKIAGKTAYETRGLWEMTNFAMGGPFLNYVIDDPDRDRYIVIEGFVFSPRENKRKYLFEIDAIAHSIEFL